MKVLIVVSSLGFGGAERTASNVSLALPNKYKVTILSFHSRRDYHYKGKLIDLKIPYEPEAAFIRKIWKSYRKFIGFRMIFKEVSPDIVLSLSEGPNIIALLGKLTGLGAKFIVNTQVTPSNIYQGVYKYIYKFLISTLYGHADRVIALSKGVREELVNKFRVPGELIDVIYNPVDIGAVEAMLDEPVHDAPFNDGFPVVVNVGRLSAQKNQSLLIKAFRRVRDETPSRLAIIGEGKLEKKLKALVSSLGLEDDVYFLGWQSNLFKYMKRATVFVLSSDYEGFGNVIVEAMASGCPVVSTDCLSGPGEILDGGRFGILVPVGDDQRLAKEILKILRNQEFRRRLSASGRVRAKAFDTHFISLSYVRLFNSLKDGTHERAARTSEKAKIQSGIQTE